ncbi:DUF6086 family protein [Streptomyces sp. NPDC005227]|uniref:DUF6086 family protein n=1 Tax=Streptomyces sp. NPDC005227 TaxID=3364707 RepID=UPI0036840D68
MSMYFDVGDVTLWNPSNGAGCLFLRQIEVFEAEIGLPSGIGQGRHRGDPDTREIDPVVFVPFVNGLVNWHCSSEHFVMRSLSEGFVATTVALARRAGIDVRIPESEVAPSPSGVRRDVQVPGNSWTVHAALGAALDARAREIDRFMAR